MLPPFDLQGGLPLACARAAAVAGLLFVFGSQVFRAVVMRRVAGPPGQDTALLDRRLLTLERGGAAAALAAMAAWTVVQSGTIAGATSIGGIVSALPLVALHTAFGHLALLQIGALAAVAVSLRLPWTGVAQLMPLPLGALALGLQAGHGHAASMYPGLSLLLMLDLLHLAGAGAWLGGLPSLMLVVRGADLVIGHSAARWFSPLGKLCIVALVASAIGQSWVLVGSLPGFLGTAYGWVLLVKLGLLGVLLGFAAANHYRFTPAMAGSAPIQARRALGRSIALETGVGLAVVLAAAVLSNLPPSMHVQTIWPFAQRFSLVTVQEDADFGREALGASLALAAAAVLLVIAVLLRRRVSLVPALGAAVIAWFAVPHLDLLFVPATPTSYYHSPTGFAATSIMAGAALYLSHCASCHGTDGRGDRPAASSLPVPPADLTASHLWMHSDGELFWWLAHGITAPDGQQAMPGFAGTLTDDQRWALIDAIRARNAGTAYRQTGRWPLPLRAPEIQARCTGNRIVTLGDLRRSFVRLVAGPAKPVAGAITIALGTADPPVPGLCVTDDPSAAQAYAVVTGLPQTRMQGAAFLIDPDGWLRAEKGPMDSPGWGDAAVLASAIKEFRHHPLAPTPAAMPMDMRM